MSTPDIGQAFEAENERSDLEHWRGASDAERGRAIAELIGFAESVVAATRIRNEEPARRLPVPQDTSGEG